MKSHFKIILTIIFTFLIVGCYSQPIIKTKEVYIPIKCTIDLPVKKSIPAFKGNKYLNNDISEDYAVYLKSKIDNYQDYVWQLEKAINFCIKGDLPNDDNNEKR